MKTIKIDEDKIIGRIKELNGVGGGPVTSNFECDATALFREARIPYSRTHDIEYPYGSGEFVDIHCVFPNFKADPYDPDSYNFTLTDEYLKAIENAGTKTFYRLGSTIEHQPVKRYIYPPADNEKWGHICSQIIAHYNEGWANGFHMGIEYWEIWNEPDLTDRCWTGTDEEFFRLYDAASRIIKAEHPNVKVGGCGFTNPHSPFIEGFLDYIKKAGSPFDFFSWHGYIHTPAQASEISDYADKLLGKYGFEGVESIYDEWNYVVSWDDTIQRSLNLHKSAFSAAFVSSVMSALQKSRTDKAMYYDVQIDMTIWNGVFRKGDMIVHGTPIPLLPLKSFYSLKAWGMLRTLGNEVYSQSDDEDLYVTAASDGSRLQVLVSYYNDDAGFAGSKPPRDEIRFELSGLSYRSAEVRITDDEHDFEPEALVNNTFTLDGNSFAFITFEM